MAERQSTQGRHQLWHHNALLETADVLKPNIMAPGSSIWAAWRLNSYGDEYIKGQNFALLSGTSMATLHIAGNAALIKQKHPDWSPSAITSAMMTTADVTYKNGAPILAQDTTRLSPASPFDLGLVLSTLQGQLTQDLCSIFPSRTTFSFYARFPALMRSL